MSLQLLCGDVCAAGCLLSVTNDWLGPCPTVTAACDGSIHLRLCALPHPLQQAGLQRQLLQDEVRWWRRPARTTVKVRGCLSHLGAGIGWGFRLDGCWYGAGCACCAAASGSAPALPMLQTSHSPSLCCTCPAHLQWCVTPPCARSRERASRLSPRGGMQQLGAGTVSFDRRRLGAQHPCNCLT